LSMLSPIRFLAPLIALAAGVAIVSLHMGCNGSSKPNTANTVRGRVSFQGRPVAGGLVIFSPDRERGSSGKALRAETVSEGLFELSFEGGSAIPPGWYRVAIAPPAADPYAGSGRAVFPPQLRRPDTSKLVREVEAGKDHFFELA